MWRRLAIFALILSTSAFAKDKVQKQTIEFGGVKRTYYLFVPTNVTAPAPLLLLLHGSGGNGRIMVDMWKDLAAKEGIVLVAPDSRDSERWTEADSSKFLHAVFEAVLATQAIDGKRMYVFGNSGGAVFALLISMLQSEYFAATAIHAGALSQHTAHFLNAATRKIPIKIFVGTEDPFFPLPAVRATRDLLASKGFTVELAEIPHHDHAYYLVARDVNRDAWEFLKKYSVAEPRFR